MSSLTPGPAPQALQPRSEAVLWAIFVALATATQLAFKWAGSQLEEQDFGFVFLIQAVAKPSVWVAIV
jgi:hypothetical protein